MGEGEGVGEGEVVGWGEREALVQNEHGRRAGQHGKASGPTIRSKACSASSSLPLRSVTPQQEIHWSLRRKSARAVSAHSAEIPSAVLVSAAAARPSS